MNPLRWRAWLAAVLIFLFGAAAGGTVVAFAGVRLLRHVLLSPASAIGPADRMAARLATDLARTLDLSPDQSARVRRMLEQSAANLKAIRARSTADVAAELRASAARIAAELPPEKRADFYRVEARRFERLGLTPPLPESGK